MLRPNRAPRRNRAPYRKRKYGGTRRYKKKTIPNRVTVVKRLSQPICIVSVNDGSVHVLNDGGGCFNLTSGSGAPNSGSLLGTSQFGGAFVFHLNQLIQYTDVINMFDRYKIAGVKLDFLFQQNTSDTAGGSMLPIMWGAYDFDDAVPPASQQVVQVKGYCRQRILSANKRFSVFIRPRVLKTASADDGTQVDLPVTSERACWLNSAYDDVDHVGYKMWIDSWTGSGVDAPKCALTIQPTFYLALKDTQ